jgi:hypothetical protein
MVKAFRPSSEGEIDSQEADSSNLPFGVKALAIIAGIVLIIMGLRSISQDVVEIRKLTSLSKFEKTQAKWLQVSIRQDTTGSSGEFYPDVLYEYFVQGKSIWGWRLSYEDQSQPQSYWEKRLIGYHKDDTVSVFVNPQDPKDAVVEKKTDGLLRPVLKALVGCGFAGFGLILVILAGFRPFKRRNHP